MAGAGGPEAGEVVACPRCGREVRQKSMIPVFADGDAGVVAPPGAEQLVCVECARRFVTTGSPVDAPPTTPSTVTA